MLVTLPLLNKLQFSSIALTVLVIIGNKEFGSGTHIWDVRPEKFVGNRLNVWESEW